MKKFLTFFILATTACTMAPRYKTPQAPVPLEKAETNKAKISTISWQQYFKSKDLQRVIEIALKNNRDLRVANLNIQEAMATHDVARADLLPSFNATGTMTRQGVPSAFRSFSPKAQYRAGISLSYFELDFFGRLQSLKKAALEDFLATREARNTTRISVITQTAAAYTQYLTDYELLKIYESDFDSQKNRHDLIQLRYENGIASKYDLYDSEAAMEEAHKLYDTYKKYLAQDKTALMILCGKFDEDVLPKAKSLDEIEIDESLLDFIPSETLLLRPDIQQAEHNLKSANADIGAARAAFFPTISLTGSVGFASRSFGSLFSQNSKTWSYTPQVSLPIFNGGRNFANLKIANLRKKIEIAEYEKTIQTAFKEVSDELANREMTYNQLASAREISRSKEKFFEISQAKYDAGIDSRLTLINNQISMLSSRQGYANSRKEYVNNLITLYKVLGGGSEVEVPDEEEKS